jgi:hypothetical protein
VNQTSCTISKSVLAVLLLSYFAVLANAETFAVPLIKTNGWQFLSYRKIPPNKFRSTRDGLEIAVTNSAAPALFPLTNALPVTELRVSGKIYGTLKMPPGKQGEKGFDDYTVRVGLVELGTRKLSWRERIAAADWVKKLFSLALPDTGIGKIRFFNIGTDARQISRARVHPMSDLMKETVVAVPDSDGHFTFTNRFAKPLQVIAVWISCDGDDTKSSFTVKLNRVELIVQ